MGGVQIAGCRGGEILSPRNRPAPGIALLVWLLGPRWGATAFAGLGCLYKTVSDCGSSDDLYPAAGAGLYYELKPEAGFVIRADYAIGDRDNSAFYLRLGHPF